MRQIIRKLDRMNRELDNYLETTGRRKKQFALMEKLGDMEICKENTKEYMETFSEFIQVSGAIVQLDTGNITEEYIEEIHNTFEPLTEYPGVDDNL